MKRFIGGIMQYASPVGVWLIALLMVADLVTNSISIETSRDVIQNQDTFSKDLRFLLSEVIKQQNTFATEIKQIQEEEKVRLSGDSTYQTDWQAFKKEWQVFRDGVSKRLGITFGLGNTEQEEPPEQKSKSS